MFSIEREGRLVLENLKALSRPGRKLAGFPVDISKMPVKDFDNVLKTPQQKDTTLKLTILGDKPTLQQLADEEGISRQAVFSRKKTAEERLRRYANGEKLDRRTSQKGERLKNKLTVEQFADLENTNLSHTAIARKEGIRWQTVQSRRRALGIIGVKMGRPRKILAV